MNASIAIARRAILVGVLIQGATTLADGQSLRSLIDQHLLPVAGLEPRLCSDAEFLRRASLDFSGMPPTVDEARAFLADPAPEKRERLIDRLIASPHYVRHMAATLDVMLMERRAATHVSVDEWQAWLLASVQEQKPWNELVREILQADGDDPAQRPAARFALDRACDPHVLTRDIGRIFFGRDLQCAQCHNHPIVAGYLQADYHGLLAFVAADYQVVRKEGDKETTVRGEKAGSDLTFESVFEGVPRHTGPRMPGSVAIEEPFFLPGEEYEAPPADNVKAVPKFSRRAKLAELATDGSNDAFNRTIANRLWAHMFGRGLVHPVDLHHPKNPAVYPKLLQLLADSLAAMDFDIRAFLHEIALSEAYQRALDPPSDIISVANYAESEIEQLVRQRAELEETCQASTSAYEAALDEWQQAEAVIVPVAEELDAALSQYAEAKNKLDEAIQVKNEAASRLASRQSAAAQVQEAAVASRKAAEALPDDAELKNAAETIGARSEKLMAEIPAISKEVEDKTAAANPLNEALSNVKPAVDAAQTKMVPFDQTLGQTEQAMLAARIRAANDAEALAALDRRLETARLLGDLPQSHSAVVAAQEVVTRRETELAAAQQQLANYGTTIKEYEAARQEATAELTAVDGALKAARFEHARRVETAEAIAAAFTAALAAQQKVPDDAVFATVVPELQARAIAAQSESTEFQRGVDAALSARRAASEALATAGKALEATAKEQARRAEVVAAAEAVLAAAQADVETKKSEFETAVAELTDRWTRDFTVAALKPLTPEQLCWSILRVTGVYDRYWQTEVAELEKAEAITEQQKQDPAHWATRQVTLEQKTFDKLKGTAGTFVSLFGAAGGQPQGDFFATPDQALFAANGGTINSWIQPAGDNVTERIVKEEDPHAAAEELYLTVLTRLPTEDEAADVAHYLTERGKDKGTAAQELVWSLVTSVEFRFNH